MANKKRFLDEFSPDEDEEEDVFSEDEGVGPADRKAAQAKPRNYREVSRRIKRSAFSNLLL